MARLFHLVPVRIGVDQELACAMASCSDTRNDRASRTLPIRVSPGSRAGSIASTAKVWSCRKVQAPRDHRRGSVIARDTRVRRTADAARDVASCPFEMVCDVLVSGRRLHGVPGAGLVQTSLFHQESDARIPRSGRAGIDGHTLHDDDHLDDIPAIRNQFSGQAVRTHRSEKRKPARGLSSPAAGSPLALGAVGRYHPDKLPVVGSPDRSKPVQRTR